MSQSAHTTIVGGGIMGLMIAVELVEAGVDPRSITLVEKRGFGAGSSGKSGAILRRHYSHPALIRMAQYGLSYYASYAERFGTDIGFVRSGVCVIAGASDRETLAKNVALQQSLGVDVQLLEADALRAALPGARVADGTLGADEVDAGFVDPRRVLEVLAARLEAAGVDLRVGRRVVDLGPALALTPRRIGLDDGTSIETDTLIIAGGPWSRSLCADLGSDLPLRAVMPEQSYFHAPAGSTMPGRVVIDLETGLYWKPEAGALTRVGKLAYADDRVIDDPDHGEDGVRTSFLQSCRTQLAQRVPAMAGATSWGGCSALYTVTPDANALVGRVPGHDDVWIVSGFCGHGFKLAPSVGRGVAALLTGGDPAPLDPELLAPDRFDRAARVDSAYAFGILG